MPQSLELDVAVVNNHWIWPFWRYVPGREMGYLLESMEINLIYCCTEDEHASYDVALAKWTYEEEFIKLISYFLRCGPSSSWFDSTTIPRGRSDFRVKTLAIDIDTASITNGRKMFSNNEVPSRRIDGLGHLTFDPLYSVDVTTCLKHVDWLACLMMKMIHRHNDGLLIRERVDRIVFSVDGRTRREIDIAKYLLSKQETMLAEYRRGETIGSSS